MPRDIEIFISDDPELTLDYCDISQSTRIEYTCQFTANPTVLYIPFLSEPTRTYTVTIVFKTRTHGSYPRKTTLSELLKKQLHHNQKKENNTEINLRLEADGFSAPSMALSWSFSQNEKKRPAFVTPIDE